MVNRAGYGGMELDEAAAPGGGGGGGGVWEGGGGIAMEGLAFDVGGAFIVRFRPLRLKGRWADSASAVRLIVVMEPIDGRCREPHAVTSAPVQQLQRFSCPG
jgi:hypothetical protein